MHHKIDLLTSQPTQFPDITARIRSILSANPVKSGVCYIFVPHTTAAVTINENADPDVVSDITAFLKKNIDNAYDYRHLEGNSPAHIKASMLGSSAVVLIENGDLVLGTWQGVYFCEFDGPRSRNFLVKIFAGS